MLHNASSALALVLLAAPALAQSKLAQFSGSANMESVGYSVVGLGDVDGDGLPDWATGAPWHPNFVQLGHVYVCSGASGALIRTLTGSIAGDDFGYAIANVGDLDGDAVAEIAVGAADFPSGGGHDAAGTAGYVQVFSGASGALVLHVDGDAANDRFGCAVAGLGDVDGDSIEDFAVGATGVEGVWTDAGMVRAVSGADGTTIWSTIGTQGNSTFGTRLASIADLDGDGIDDVVVGAPSFDGPPVDIGAAFVLSGASGAIVRTWLGEGGPTRFGGSVAGLGDIDGDGAPDVAVGAVDAPLSTSNGKLYAYSGQGGALLWQRVGQGYLGYAVADAGDLDGDGRSDVVAGAITSHSAGLQYDGYLHVFSGVDGHELGRVIGGQAEYLGYSVAGVGDVDGDGRRDFVAGGVDANASQRGFARVFGTEIPMPPSSYCIAKTNSQGCIPSISSSGTPTIGGADDFAVHAEQVINNKLGLFLWGASPARAAFQGGFLCVGAPQKRTSVVNSGGSASGADCSGVLSYTFTHAYMQAQGLSAGSMLYVQGWHRDTALPFNPVGLSDALLAFLVP